MPFVDKSPLNYPPNSFDPIPRRIEDRPPIDNQDGFKYKLFTQWLDSSSQDLYVLVDKTKTTTTWALIGGTGAAIETITGDSGGPVPPDAANNLNLLGLYTNSVVGTPGTNTLTITPTDRGFPITPYVVGPVGFAGYQTVQAALDAANAAGGGAVWVMPQGSPYNENLTLYDNTVVVGSNGTGDTTDLIINGVHTPPSTGSFIFRNIWLQSTTHIFSSNAAGSASLFLVDCFQQITNGYTFNVPNWTGTCTGFNLGEQSTENGVINNTGGGALVVTNSSIGKGTANSMITTGAVELYNVVIDCPITFQTGTTGNMGGGTRCTKNVTFSNDSSLNVANSLFETGATQAITYNSSGASTFSKCSVDSTNNPAIGGTGAGAITVGDITFLNNFQVADTLTFSTSGVMRTTRQVIGPRGELSHTLNGATINSDLEVHAEDTQDLGGITLHRHTNTAAYGGHIVNLRSNGTHTSPTIVTDGDIISRYIAAGYDGTDYALGADARFEVDGTPGANDMPMRYVMLLSPDGTQVPAEVMRITQAGERLLPKQPVFRARYFGAIRTNVTGDGTSVIITNYNFEDIDVGGNFDPVAGTFTAPVAGNYYFSGGILIESIGAANPSAQSAIRVNTTPGNSGWATGASNTRNGGNQIHLEWTDIRSLAASDVVDLGFLVTGAAKNVGYSYANLEGFLIC